MSKTSLKFSEHKCSVCCSLPAWSTLITAHENARIESVLKTGLFLVYGHRYESFSWAFREANMSSLEDQRTRHFEKFTQTCLKNNKFQKWFVRIKDSTDGVVTRKRKARFKPVYTRTASYARSAIPHMVKVANNQHKSDSHIRITLNSGQILVLKCLLTLVTMFRADYYLQGPWPYHITIVCLAS